MNFEKRRILNMAGNLAWRLPRCCGGDADQVAARRLKPPLGSP
jgi:hypothetical protein